MKFLLPVSFLLLSSVVFSQSFNPIPLDKDAQSKLLFKKDLALKPIQIPGSWNRFSIPKVELDAQGIMINPYKSSSDPSPGSMPCLKPNNMSNMICIIPDENSLMPIINPTDSKYALIVDFK